jgi:hypothetical protein
VIVGDMGLMIPATYVVWGSSQSKQCHRVVFEFPKYTYLGMAFGLVQKIGKCYRGKVYDLEKEKYE